jgi:plasmid stabilization system protein ParE
MDLKWTSRALSDLGRLHDFLAAANRKAASRVIQSLVAAPLRLIEHPHLGEKLSAFEPRNVRQILVGKVEMRYEIESRAIIVLRLWHTRESR